MEENYRSIIFRLTDNQNTTGLDASEKDLLRLVSESSDETGKADIINYAIKYTNAGEKAKIKEHYINFDNNVKNNYAKKNRLTASQIYYRNLGLILGVILFAAGCIVSVAFSVLSAYLMLPAGFLVFWYSYSIQRRTPYSIERIKALNELRKLLNKSNKNEKVFPECLTDINRLIGLSIAIRAENKLHLLEGVFKDKNIKSIEDTLEKALIALYNSISAILDS